MEMHSAISRNPLCNGAVVYTFRKISTWGPPDCVGQAAPMSSVDIWPGGNSFAKQTGVSQRECQAPDVERWSRS